MFDHACMVQFSLLFFLSFFGISSPGLGVASVWEGRAMAVYSPKKDSLRETIPLQKKFCNVIFAFEK